MHPNTAKCFLIVFFVAVFVVVLLKITIGCVLLCVSRISVMEEDREFGVYTARQWLQSKHVKQIIFSQVIFSLYSTNNCQEQL